MRRRWIGAVLGTLGVLCASLSPAHASLFDSVRGAVARVRDALPVRIGLGASSAKTAAQRDSIKRVRLARLNALSVPLPAARLEDRVFLAGGFEMTFTIDDSIRRDVTVHRRDKEGKWRVAGRVWADHAGRATWREANSKPGRVVELALGLKGRRSSPFVILPPTRMPGGTGIGLRLTASTAADRSVRLELELPTRYPVTLEVFDVSGRRVAEIPVAGLRTGANFVYAPRSLFPDRGVYLARLEQRGEWATAKFVVTR